MRSDGVSGSNGSDENLYISKGLKSQALSEVIEMLRVACLWQFVQWLVDDIAIFIPFSTIYRHRYNASCI